MINFGRSGTLPSVPEHSAVHTKSLMNLGSTAGNPNLGAASSAKKTLSRAEVLKLGEQVR